MKEKRKEYIEWLFIVACIIPAIILGKMRLHQQDLAVFLIAVFVCVAVVMAAYCIYRRKNAGIIKADAAEEETSEI